MGKLVLLAIAAALLYFFLRAKKSSYSNESSSKRAYITNSMKLIEAKNAQIIQLSKKTVKIVGIGFILLLITVFLAFKIKILIFLIPISLYLMGHIFLMSNHIKACKDQQIYFNPQTNEMSIHYIQGTVLAFNLVHEVLKVEKIESIQNSRGVFYGYYRLTLKQKQVHIPYLVMDNLPANQLFVDALQAHFKISTERRLFPII